MDNRDNGCVKLVDAEEARNGINSLIEQYRQLLESIDNAIKEHEKELAELRTQRDRLVTLIPRNQPLER